VLCDNHRHRAARRAVWAPQVPPPPPPTSPPRRPAPPPRPTTPPPPPPAGPRRGLAPVRVRLPVACGPHRSAAQAVSGPGRDGRTRHCPARAPVSGRHPVLTLRPERSLVPATRAAGRLWASGPDRRRPARGRAHGRTALASLPHLDIGLTTAGRLDGRGFSGLLSHPRWKCRRRRRWCLSRPKGHRHRLAFRPAFAGCTSEFPPGPPTACRPRSPPIPLR
jgi:hypothetical protein